MNNEWHELLENAAKQGANNELIAGIARAYAYWCDIGSELVQYV
jgi:hypothetical protein